MASLSHLTTKAMCGEVLDRLGIKLTTYEHQTSNIDYAEEVAGRTATNTATRLAKATADVTRYTTDVARPGQTPVELRRAQSALITATAQRDHLALDTTAQTGSEAYLDEVATDQLDGQVAVITARIAEVTVHRDTLSA